VNGNDKENPSGHTGQEQRGGSEQGAEKGGTDLGGLGWKPQNNRVVQNEPPANQGINAVQGETIANLTPTTSNQGQGGNGGVVTGILEGKNPHIKAAGYLAQPTDAKKKNCPAKNGQGQVKRAERPERHRKAKVCILRPEYQCGELTSCSPGDGGLDRRGEGQAVSGWGIIAAP
jgi:hypothetical protein